MVHEAYALIPRHGAEVLFLAALLSCAGLPIPTSAMMLAAGAFVAAGDMAFLPVFAATLIGALIGDQIGFAAGRFGGTPLWNRFRRNPRLTATMDRAAAELDARAVQAVVLTRFPLSALGPWVNLAAGGTGVAWARFTAGVFVGDLVWVLVYLGGGAVFAARIKALGTGVTSALGALAALMAAAYLGRILLRRMRGRTGTP